MKELVITRTVLKTTYQNIVDARVVHSQEMQNILSKLTALLRHLIRIVERARDDHDKRQVSLLNTDFFEDIIALSWLIAWLLFNKRLDISSFVNLLHQLQAKHSGVVDIGYEALVTKLILELINHPNLDDSKIQWCNRFSELKEPVRSTLEKIHKEVISFTNVNEFQEDIQNKQRLLSIFLESYYGFLYSDETDQKDKNELDIIFYDLIREPWQRRFRRHKDYPRTENKILCTYSSGIDVAIRLNTELVMDLEAKIAKAEGVEKSALVNELGNFLRDIISLDSELPTYIERCSDLLKIILGYISLINNGKNVASKVDIQNKKIDIVWDIVDFLIKIDPDADKFLGGAAATAAETLLALEKSPGTQTNKAEIHFMPPFISESLLKLLPPDLQLVWLNGQANELQIGTKEQFKDARKATSNLTKHPEIRNTIIEFSSGEAITYCGLCGDEVRPDRTDRLIVRNKYAYYQNGRIDRTTTQLNELDLKVNGLFGFDSGIEGELSLDDRLALVEQAARESYNLLILTGIQSLDKSVQEDTEQELKTFTNAAPQTKIHLEVSGTKHFPWLIKILKAYNIHSIGIGEELATFFKTIRACISDLIDVDTRRKLERIVSEVDELDTAIENYGYQQTLMALGIASILNMERLYVHDVNVDIIVCKGRLAKDEVSQEIRADLIAKWTVLRKLMSRGRVARNKSRDTMTQVKEAGFQTLIETARRLEEHPYVFDNNEMDIALYGIYFDEPLDRSVILVPVRWVYGDMQDRLRVVGAGDTSSIIYAAQIHKN